MAGRRLLFGSIGAALAAPAARPHHHRPAGAILMVMPAAGYDACLRHDVETLARLARDAGFRPD